VINQPPLSTANFSFQKDKLNRDSLKIHQSQLNKD